MKRSRRARPDLQPQSTTATRLSPTLAARDIRYNGWDALLKARASWVDVMGKF